MSLWRKRVVTDNAIPAKELEPYGDVCPICHGTGKVTRTEYRMVREADHYETVWETKWKSGPTGGRVAEQVPKRNFVPGQMVSKPFTEDVPCTACGGTGKKR